jgi:hypothetical protein
VRDNAKAVACSGHESVRAIKPVEMVGAFVPQIIIHPLVTDQERTSAALELAPSHHRLQSIDELCQLRHNPGAVWFHHLIGNLRCIPIGPEDIAVGRM